MEMVGEFCCRAGLGESSMEKGANRPVEVNSVASASKLVGDDRANA